MSCLFFWSQTNGSFFIFVTNDSLVFIMVKIVEWRQSGITHKRTNSGTGENSLCVLVLLHTSDATKSDFLLWPQVLHIK